MKWTIPIGLAALLSVSTFLSPAQDRPGLRILEPETALRFLPDKVTLEAETIAVDVKNLAALQFPDGSRIAIAPLLTFGCSPKIQLEYRYVLVSETAIQLDRWTLPSGVVGLGWAGPADPTDLTRCLVAHDFSGAEILRIRMDLNTSAPSRTGLTVKGEREFELRLGYYVIRGVQRKLLIS
jgi:hypothetical protein